jgi:hypothetical protein
VAEELEVLHGACYEELEHSAKYQQRYTGGITPTLPDPGPFPGSVELDKNSVVVNPAASPASAIGNNRNRNQRQTRQVGRIQREEASMDVEDEDEDEEVFTTFAARMFEQLSQAYREKLTQEQQLQLKKAAEGILASKAEQTASEEENKMEEECAKHEVVSQAQEEERDVVLIIYSGADDCQGRRFLRQCQSIPTDTP